MLYIVIKEHLSRRRRRRFHIDSMVLAREFIPFVALLAGES